MGASLYAVGKDGIASRRLQGAAVELIHSGAELGDAGRPCCKRPGCVYCVVRGLKLGLRLGFGRRRINVKGDAGRRRLILDACRRGRCRARCEHSFRFVHVDARGSPEGEQRARGILRGGGVLHRSVMNGLGRIAKATRAACTSSHPL